MRRHDFSNYWTARKDYRIIREMPAIVVELKYNKTAQTAIWQIKDKKYAAVLGDYSGEVVLVGINYDKDKKEMGIAAK